MTKTALFTALSLWASSFCLTANAEIERTIEGTRIQLKDVSDGYDEGELASLDLGPAPPPGNSRLLSRAEVEEQLRAAGDDAKSLRMPQRAAREERLQTLVAPGAARRDHATTDRRLAARSHVQGRQAEPRARYLAQRGHRPGAFSEVPQARGRAHADRHRRPATRRPDGRARYRSPSSSWSAKQPRTPRPARARASTW